MSSATNAILMLPVISFAPAGAIIGGQNFAVKGSITKSPSTMRSAAAASAMKIMRHHDSGRKSHGGPVTVAPAHREQPECEQDRHFVRHDAKDVVTNDDDSAEQKLASADDAKACAHYASKNIATNVSRKYGTSTAAPAYSRARRWPKNKDKIDNAERTAP